MKQIWEIIGAFFMVACILLMAVVIDKKLQDKPTDRAEYEFGARMK